MLHLQQYYANIVLEKMQAFKRGLRKNYNNFAQPLAGERARVRGYKQKEEIENREKDNYNSIINEFFEY